MFYLLFIYCFDNRRLFILFSHLSQLLEPINNIFDRYATSQSIRNLLYSNKITNVTIVCVI